MAGIFGFILGVPGKLGVGTADLGFRRSQSIGLTSIGGPGVHVRRSFAPNAPGYVKTGQNVVPVAWTGQGSGLVGTFDLGTLASDGK